MQEQEVDRHAGEGDLSTSKWPQLVIVWVKWNIPTLTDHIINYTHFFLHFWHISHTAYSSLNVILSSIPSFKVPWKHYIHVHPRFGVIVHISMKHVNQITRVYITFSRMNKQFLTSESNLRLPSTVVLDLLWHAGNLTISWRIEWRLVHLA